MWDSSRGRREEEGQEEQEEEEEEDTASALLFVHGRGPGQPAEQSRAEQSQREGLPASQCVSVCVCVRVSSGVARPG